MRALLGGLTWRRASLVIIDHALIILGILLALVIRFGEFDYRFVSWPYLWRAALVAAILQVGLHYYDLYDTRMLRDRRDLIIGLLRAFGTTSLILALLYYWVPVLVIGRGVFLISTGLIIALIAAWRLSFEWISSRVGPAERLLILGTSSAAVDLARELYQRRFELGVELVGFVDVDPKRVGEPMLNPGVIGTIADIPALVSERSVDRVVVSLADARGMLPMDTLLNMKLTEGVRFDHLPSVYEEYTGKIAVENLRPSWLIFSAGFRQTRTMLFAKRTIDVVFAAVGLVMAAPIMALVALGVRLTSAGPALYHQVRVGRGGRPFTVHKFRSMRQDAEATTGAVWAKKSDPRVTGFGRFLRRTRLDELPQLWNVLSGEMSFVGPRPERPEFVRDLTAQIPFYGQRHVVRPGLTGWAQVRHSYGASVNDAIQKLQYELYYIKHMSISFDLYIVLETTKTVLMRRGS